MKKIKIKQPTIFAIDYLGESVRYFGIFVEIYLRMKPGHSHKQGLAAVSF
ncbi:hypothetical protein TPHV1_500008 [Treponema phagedenis]|uniref:Uncharacterized protein n=1 Tax=Treponema phagedenis TaxID=162 RepID=A0A0B7H0W3_TREPH|nr:hypothetical protein TPHV1_500008 [Treponema phagedenis]